MADLLCDLFYYDRVISYTDDMLNQMWNSDKKQFIAIAFHLRRHTNLYCDGVTITGRGERKIFYQIIVWMSQHKLKELLEILPAIPDCGCWKDVLYLLGTPAESAVINFMCSQLTLDYRSFTQNKPGKISLLAKWVPNENSSFDRKHQVFSKMVNLMNITRKELRVTYLVPMRRYLGVTEQLITDGDFEDINYYKVPKTCHAVNHKVFMKHDGERYRAYLSNIHSAYFHKFNLPPLLTIIINDFDIPDSRVERNEDLLVCLDVRGAMEGFPLALASCFVIDSGTDKYMVFDHFTQDSQCDAVIGKLTGTIQSHRMEEIGSLPESGHSILTCLQAAQQLNKKHMVVISNVLVDEQEIPRSSDCHITYWALANKAATIMDYENVTLIEGYDINVYYQLCKAQITRDKFKQSMTKILCNNFYKSK
jgi:hypothetical protein